MTTGRNPANARRSGVVERHVAPARGRSKESHGADRHVLRVEHGLRAAEVDPRPVGLPPHQVSRHPMATPFRYAPVLRLAHPRCVISSIGARASYARRPLAAAAHPMSLRTRARRARAEQRPALNVSGDGTPRRHDGVLSVNRGRAKREALYAGLPARRTDMDLLCGGIDNPPRENSLIRGRTWCRTP